MEKSFEQRVAEAVAEVSKVSPREASQRATNEPDTLFLDPRAAEDIQSTTGIIPGAINVTLDQLGSGDDDNLPHELRSRTRPIITACEGGPMGALAAYELQKRGYQRVQFIEGGTQAWLAEGFATTKQ